MSLRTSRWIAWLLLLPMATAYFLVSTQIKVTPVWHHQNNLILTFITVAG